MSHRGWEAVTARSSQSEATGSVLRVGLLLLLLVAAVIVPVWLMVRWDVFPWELVRLPSEEARADSIEVPGWQQLAVFALAGLSLGGVAALVYLAVLAVGTASHRSPTLSDAHTTAEKAEQRVAETLTPSPDKPEDFARPVAAPTRSPQASEFTVAARWIGRFNTSTA